MKENPNNEASARYVLLEADRLETLVRTNYLLSKSLLAFEHLCSHSDRPMYLTARGVCEVLGISETELDESRLKRLIRAKVVQHRMMYDLYDLVQLAERLCRRRLQRRCRTFPASSRHPQETTDVSVSSHLVLRAFHFRSAGCGAR